jgi:electron transport complex protein RnfE
MSNQLVDIDNQVSASDEFLKGIAEQNNVFVQVLGMCPTLAVTNSAINALAMGLATSVVLVMSNMTVSLVRNWVPKQVRLVTFILIIATFVTIVDYAIQALSLELHRALGAFIALIVVNCLILGRAEAFASKNPPFRSILDGAGMGLGFTLALLCLGVVREILGSGSLFGVRIMGMGFQPWVVMLLPPGGFFTLAGWVLLLNLFNQRRNLLKNQRKAQVDEVASIAQEGGR